MTITVGIAGATGKFALLLADNLRKSPNVQIRCFCRNPGKLPQDIRSPSQVTVIQGEATDEAALRSFVHGCDVVVCCYLGDNVFMTNGQKLLIDACEHENVPRYVASDYCLDFTKLEYGDHPNKDPMKHVKAYLDTKKNVKGVHVLIGVFMETLWSRDLGIFHPDDNRITYYGTGDEIWESTTYGTAAEYVAAVALDRSAVDKQEFLGDRKSIRQIADDFADVYGQKPQLECLGTLEDLYKSMQATYQKDPSNLNAWLAQFYQYYCTSGQTYLKEELDNSKYPQIKPVTFKEFMQSNRSAEMSK